MHFLVNIIFTHFLGSTNDITLLTGVNFGITYNNIFLYFICYGIIQGMAVFCPNSFSQRQYTLIGIQTNLVRVIVIVIFCIFICFTWLFGKHVLVLLSGNDTELISVAYRYVIYSIIGNLFEMFFNIHSKYCESHLFYKPIMHTLIISIVGNFICCYVFMKCMRLNEIGAALAYNLTNALKFIYIFIAVEYVNPYPQSNFWFRRDICNITVFKDVFKICIYSMLISYSETLGYCLSNIFSVRLSALSYAKYIVVGNVYLITFCISMGANNTVTILTSYFYGLKQSDNIKKCFYLVVVVTMIMNVPVWTVFIVWYKEMTVFFSESEDVVGSKDLLGLFFISAFTQVFDTLQNEFQAALRGLEILDVLTYAMFAVFLVFMPGMAFVLAFKVGLDVAGILLAELMSYGLMFGLLCYWLCWRVDVEKLCERERESVNEGVKCLDYPNLIRQIEMDNLE